MIYFGQVFTLVILASVIYLLIEGGRAGAPDNAMALQLVQVFLIAVPVSMGAAYNVLRFMVRKLPANSTLPQKMKKYHVAVIIRSALLEAIGLFIIVAAFVTAQTLMLIVIPVIIFVFILLRPNEASAVADLQLDHEERILVENPDALIA